MCIPEGMLRARIDEQLTADELNMIETHLAGCARCQLRTAEIEARARRVDGLLSRLAPLPTDYPSNARIALSRFKVVSREQPRPGRDLTILGRAKRLCTTSLQIPLPLAAAIVIAVAIVFFLVAGGGEPQLVIVSPSPLPERVRVVEVPVIREKIVKVNQPVGARPVRSEGSSISTGFDLAAYVAQKQLRALEFNQPAIGFVDTLSARNMKNAGLFVPAALAKKDDSAVSAPCYRLPAFKAPVLMPIITTETQRIER